MLEVHKCAVVDTATVSWWYIVLTLASESDSACSLAVCKLFCISLNSTPKTSGRTAFCRQEPAKDSQYLGFFKASPFHSSYALRKRHTLARLVLPISFNFRLFKGLRQSESLFTGKGRAVGCSINVANASRANTSKSHFCKRQQATLIQGTRSINLNCAAQIRRLSKR